MKSKILIFIAVAIIIGVSCQNSPTTKKATTTKVRQGATTSKRSGLVTQTTKKSGLATQSTKRSGLNTPTTKKSVSSPTRPRVQERYTFPTAAPTITCENVTGVANFQFIEFATGVWYLHKEMCAFPFNPFFGFCSKGTFTLSDDKKSSSLEVNTMLEGIFLKSPVSTLTPSEKSGVMNWNITKVGIRTELMTATSTLKLVVVGTDYKNWAAGYVCGKLCVSITPPTNGTTKAPATTKKPKPTLPPSECSPGMATCYMILLRNRSYTDEKVRDEYIKAAEDALKVQFPYVLTMPNEQSSAICKN